MQLGEYGVKAMAASAAIAVPLAAIATPYATSMQDVYRAGYALTGDALVMIPAFNRQWLDATNTLYLEPNGFDGTPVFLQVPETYDLNTSVKGATDILVQAIESRWDTGDFSEADPLWVFGYSQAAVVAGMAEQQLADYGIPQDALHFVLVGDSASAQGGFLNEFTDWLDQFFPESWHQSVNEFVMQMLAQFNADSVFGAITPDNLYPTDVYTLTGDGWANWADGTNMSGMFSQHLAYLGLTPDEVSSATENVVGLTNYFTIDSADVDMWSALENALTIGVSPFM